MIKRRVDYWADKSRIPYQNKPVTFVQIKTNYGTSSFELVFRIDYVKFWPIADSLVQQVQQNWYHLSVQLYNSYLAQFPQVLKLQRPNRSSLTKHNKAMKLKIESSTSTIKTPQFFHGNFTAQGLVKMTSNHSNHSTHCTLILNSFDLILLH